MDIYSEIKEKIKNIAGGGQPAIFAAKVTAVDGAVCTVEIGEGLTVSDVSLRAVINDESDRLMVIPKVGSYVLVADLSGGNLRRLAVVGCSEPERVNVEIGGENLLKVLEDFIDEVAKIIVVQGTSPNVPALNLIKNRLGKILK